MSVLTSVQKTLLVQSQAIADLIPLLNKDFERVVAAIHQSKGRLVISGIGKSALIAQKIVATCNSTGTPSLFLHAADAIHGDLGMVTEGDIVIIISKSGESEEIILLAQLVKKMGNLLIALCGNASSSLVQIADYFIDSTVAREACPNNLAPTTSTSAQLALGDALAICLLEEKGFTAEDFAKFHPGGALGKQLYLRVEEVASRNSAPQVQPSASIKDVILAITSGRLGATAVVEKEQLVGIITDGDLRRMLQSNPDITKYSAQDIMNKTPKCIESKDLAVNALSSMQQNNISQLLVVDQLQYKGMVHLHDLLKEGLI